MIVKVFLYFFTTRLEIYFILSLFCLFGAKCGGINHLEMTTWVSRGRMPDFITNRKPTQSGTRCNINQSELSQKAASKFLSDSKPVLAFFLLSFWFFCTSAFLRSGHVWKQNSDFCEKKPNCCHRISSTFWQVQKIDPCMFTQLQWKLQAFRDSSSASWNMSLKQFPSFYISEGHLWVKENPEGFSAWVYFF